MTDSYRGVGRQRDGVVVGCGVVDGDGVVEVRTVR
jgi:hypothetical protein